MNGEGGGYQRSMREERIYVPALILFYQHLPQFLQLLGAGFVVGIKLD